MTDGCLIDTVNVQVDFVRRDRCDPAGCCSDLVLHFYEVRETEETELLFLNMVEVEASDLSNFTSQFCGAFPEHSCSTLMEDI